MCIDPETKEQGEMELFCGSIKSFNARRGFGFLSCEETALRFGRDVYLSKEEAMTLAVGPAVGQVATTGTAPPVLEGDVLLFQVKLSVEGFPQAVQAKKIRRLRGVVQQAPSSEADGIVIVSGDGGEGANAVLHDPDEALKGLLGAEVRLRQAECGQLQLMANDEVAFCCASMADSDGQVLGAQLVELLGTSRVDGSFLGCFSLKLPVIASDSMTEWESNVTFVELHGHALSHCIYLSDMPPHIDVPDLMCLFTKLGGTDAMLAPASGDNMLRRACISFSGPEEVAKFLARATHTISDGGVTELAHVGPCRQRRCGNGLCSCASETPWCGADSRSASSGSQLLLTDSEAKQAPVEPAMCGPCMVLEANNAMPLAAASCTSSTKWRCIHSNIVLPTMAPEMFLASDSQCSVCIQWPTVVHASAYIVELLNEGTMTTQRFVRVTSEGGALPTLMDLRLDGLQPYGIYAACVRCVAPCGCESDSSPWSRLALGSVAPPSVMPLASALHALPPNGPAVLVGFLAQPCPAPPSAPPSFPSTIAATQPVMLASIPEAEETNDVVANCTDEILTLD